MFVPRAVDAESPPKSEQLGCSRANRVRASYWPWRQSRARAGQAGIERGNELPRPGERSIRAARTRRRQLFSRVAAARLPHPPPEGPRRVRVLRGPGLGLLVVEFEPPVIEKLRGDLTRISVVAAVAGAVLLAFAVAWSRSAARLAAVERKAAREQRLVALGSMALDMAHELRNPLTSLKGHAQLLVEDLEEPKQRAKAERVVREASGSSLRESRTSGRDGRSSARRDARELVSRALRIWRRKRERVPSDAPTSCLDEERRARATHWATTLARRAARRRCLRVAQDGATC